MNLILFDEGEFNHPLAVSDPRAVHLRKILRRKNFQEFDAGIINGPRGKARIEREGPEGWDLRFSPLTEPPELHPLILAAGAGRPQTAKKILREVTALGVSEIIFFGTERGEKAYLESSIYKDENIRPLLIEGAQQAFCTRLPRIKILPDIEETAADILSDKPISAAMDNYEAEISLKEFMAARFGKSAKKDGKTPAVIWIGSERGWSSKERDLFRDLGVSLVSLGRRVLRTETAAVAGISVCLAEMGLLD